MQVRPYITFYGEGREAIGLYCRAFQTEPGDMMLGKNLPQGDGPGIPESQLEWVVQAVIPFGDNFIRLSDCFGELNDAPSERVSIAVEASVDEVKHAFAVLAEEGRVGIPLQAAFFSPCHGVVFDKFGVMWNFVAQEEE